MKVGLIGLGNMGIPMAANLLVAGHRVTVYNRTKSKADELARVQLEVRVNLSCLVLRG